MSWEGGKGVCVCRGGGWVVSWQGRKGGKVVRWQVGKSGRVVR